MLPTLLVAMDMTALLLALPRLSAGLGTTNVQQQWISDSYGFMVAGLQRVVPGVAAGATRRITGWRLGRERLAAVSAAVAPESSSSTRVVNGHGHVSGCVWLRQHGCGRLRRRHGCRQRTDPWWGRPLTASNGYQFLNGSESER